MQQFERPMLVDHKKVRSAKTTKTPTRTATQTRTVPSISRLWSSAGSSDSGYESSDDSQSNSYASKELSVSSTPVLVAEDLYTFPPDLFPVYRRLNWLVRLILAGIIGNIVLLADNSLQSRKIRQGFQFLFTQGPIYAATQLMLQLQNSSWASTWRWLWWLMGFVLRYAVLTTLPILILQERFCRPSRISAQELKQKYSLPSTLSRFENVPVQTKGFATSVGLHWLEYTNPSPEARQLDQARKILHCNHGFGASSLSWLPCLRGLTRKLGCSVGLAHDRLGFGFSEPPSEISNLEKDFLFSTAGSSRVASSLLETKSLGKNDTVVLLGHSMGTLTTLRLALDLPEEMPKRIILVAPALGMLSLKERRNTQNKILLPVSWVLRRTAGYALRRLVGTPGFWRNGLKSVWGDSKRLKDSDVLRFQWPSVHKDWEPGLLRFATAARVSVPEYDDLGPISDQELLRKVLSQPNTTVEVILGGKDPIVSSARARKFFEPFPEVKIQELAGLGHDPFEEDVEAFLDAVHQ